MSHRRNDSKMVHSSRKSYKDKLAKLQAAPVLTTDESLEILQIQGDANTLLQQVQDESHRLASRVAEAAKSAIDELDNLSFCEGLKFPMVKKRIDECLLNMNVDIMLRRSSDIINLLEERVGLLTLAYNTAKKNLDAIQSETLLLKSPLRRAHELHIATYGVGKNPTDLEKADFESNGGKLTRFNLDYNTDISDSESEDEQENDDAGTYALALRN